MNPVVLFELLIGAFLVLLLVTQVLWPGLRGKSLFPLFRREWRLQKQLQEVKQRQEERHLEQTIAREERRLKPIQSPQQEEKKQ